MTILITGGTGFIGGNLVRELIEENEEVRILARRSSNIEYIKDLGVEIVYGDILNKESLALARAICLQLRYHRI